jgi:hypothetical protein
MRNRLILAIASVVVLTEVLAAAPLPPSAAGPSAEARKQIEDRRSHIREFAGTNREGMTPEQLADLDRRLQPQLDELATALAHKDLYIYAEAVRDLVNGEYRAFPPDKIYALLLPRLKASETNEIRIQTQAWVMEYLSRSRGNATAKEALPDMLRILGDDKLTTYLRGQAIDAVARMAPGDPRVVQALIAALENPNPTTSSGIHDVAAQRLGDMGKAAAPAKKALVKLFERGEWYQDPAYIALGKIERDDKPRELAEYLKRLDQLDALPVEQGAAAFLHIVELGRTGKKQFIGNPPRETEIIAPDVARAARPVLLKVVQGRPNDVHSRAALRALRDLGAGPSPQTARILVGVLLKYHDALDAGRKEIAALNPGPEREAKALVLFRVYTHNRDDLLLDALASIEPADKEAVVPIAEAFARFASHKEEWNIAVRLAQNLARFGKGAAPAVPAVLEGLRSLPLGAQRNVYYVVFADYLEVLVAAGGEVPGVRQGVIELLDPAGNALANSGPNAMEIQGYLLLALARIGLPAEGTRRTAALTRLREALASDRIEVFSAAAKVVAAEKTWTGAEARPVVQDLARVLPEAFAFRAPPKESDGHPQLRFAFEDQALLGRGLALRALASLGPLAKDALPAVKAIASREPQKRTSDFLPEPPINFIIREARGAQKAIEPAP